MRYQYSLVAASLGGAVCLSAFTSNVQAQNLLTNGNLDQTYPQVIVDNAPPGAGPEDFFLPKPLGWVNEGTRAITGPYEDELSSEPWAGPAPTPGPPGWAGARVPLREGWGVGRGARGSDSRSGFDSLLLKLVF